MSHSAARDRASSLGIQTRSFTTSPTSHRTP